MADTPSVVYVLLYRYPYEPYQFHSPYRTREGAERAAAEYRELSDAREYVVQEHRVRE